MFSGTVLKNATGGLNVKKILANLLILLMLIGCVPATWAEDETVLMAEEPAEEIVEETAAEPTEEPAE